MNSRFLSLISSEVRSYVLSRLVGNASRDALSKSHALFYLFLPSNVATTTFLFLFTPYGLGLSLIHRDVVLKFVHNLAFEFKDPRYCSNLSSPSNIQLLHSTPPFLPPISILAPPLP